ncbi:formin-like protein 3 isoform X2 [Iris pallida]|uniref:Formin-like protein 3 isoform X2 n=1 Tax=Iris pallida TaxID=29817 RepID=A0AAX6HWK4_IRIPA|nr:formin-like protein 3 isoform X2 [Iris pallida]
MAAPRSAQGESGTGDGSRRRCRKGGNGRRWGWRGDDTRGATGSTRSARQGRSARSSTGSAAADTSKTKVEVRGFRSIAGVCDRWFDRIFCRG